MAQRSHQFSYQNVEIFRNEENTLGIGSYGAVYQAKCDELPCAAKCLHPVFFQFNDPGMLDAIRKFEQECHFLSTVRHPNIIQYLGMIQDPDSGRPVLLMELMDESLTRFLERQTGPLHYHVQVSLVYDITLALAYLHSNGMVHRDLSSNNVLLIAGSRAKVTDFGMSKLITVNPRMTPLTQCPGTLVYMAPEALRDPPVYSEKLDCFSEGVLIIQIITRQFPDPGPATCMMDDPRSPVGALQVPIPDPERRHSHIVLVDPAHPLLQISLRCLEYRQENRPTAQDICRNIAALKEAPQYAESVQQASERGQSAATEGEGQDREVIEQLERQNRDLQEQLQEKDVAIAAEQREIQGLTQELQTTRGTNRDLQQQIQFQNDLQEQLHHRGEQLQEKDIAIAAEQGENQRLRQQLQTMRAKNRHLQQQIQSQNDKLHHRDEQLQEKDIAIAAEQGENQRLRQQLQTTRAKNRDLHQQLQSQNDQLQAKNITIASCHRDFQQLGQEVQEKGRVIEARERQLRELNQKLQSNEQVTAEFQQNLLQKERMIRDLEERLAAKDKEIRELQQQQNSRRAGGESIQLTWREGGKAPCTMSRGAAAVEGSMAYFRPGGSKQVHTYDSEEEEWSQLPECPHSLYSLAVVKGMVTTVGGYDSANQDTNTLLSLTGQGRDRKWVEHFPPMPTKRYYTAIAYNGRNLIVAGGSTDYERVSTVEVLDTENLQWYTAASLPDPLACATATICGDKVYLLGGTATKSVFTCSLTDLLQSCQPQSLGVRLRRTLSLEDKPTLRVWHTIADIPVYKSTCTTLRGELVAVGGYESDYKKTTAIYQYSPSTNSWKVISHMKTARSSCFVAVLPNNKLVVAGGLTGRGVGIDVVEIATVL